jgi:tubulin monoglycylase TTLL3/8
MHSFEVFGLDFMIDQKYKAWLIEINTNPCLEFSCALLAKIISEMLENAFKIGLDPLFPPPAFVPSSKYQLIPDVKQKTNRF